ncbi:MAG: DUF1553 domain-containing protein, partial [Verrucomicrobiae bacterium]|nr:DUF1553 domain-containing protein [Verrucomicrobiae bacterium]
QSAGVFAFPQGAATVSVGGSEADGLIIADAVQFLPEGTAALPVVAETETPEGRSAEDAAEIARIRAVLKEKNARLAALDKSKPKLPTVMAVDDATAPADTPLRIRGMVRSFGESIPRGFLQVTQPAGQPVAEIATGSGRLELANWLASPDNPLTARVMANRLWLHLFGEGIVASPDNFGTTGDAPTHPELLDYLAGRLIESGWSTKTIVREIVLSRAWAMSSEWEEADPLASRIDPDNRLLHRGHRRKLDAESLRDSLVSFSGSLDRTGGGPALPEDFKSEYDPMETSLCRSVYVPVFRNQVDEVLNTFDFANPNFTVGKRSESSIPTQSLFLMNSPFIHQQAELAAKRLLDSPETETASRIDRAYRLVLGRSPTETESRLSAEFVRAEGPDRLETWSALMRTLFGCVDFQYLR